MQSLTSANGTSIDTQKTEDRRNLAIPGAFLIRRTPIQDSRGQFTPVLKQADLIDSPKSFSEANLAESDANVFRGMHFQKLLPQGKFVRSIYGTIIDFILDLRKGPTYGKHVAIRMRPNVDSVYVPPGCAHGYFTLTPATVLYLCTTPHVPEYDAGFHHSAVQNDTPIQKISERDKTLPKFNFRGFFDEKLVWHDGF